jgi:hypothetical protein
VSNAATWIQTKEMTDDSPFSVPGSDPDDFAKRSRVRRQEQE